MAAGRDHPNADSKALWHEVHQQIPRYDIKLGTASAATYVSDARMIAFMAARYKFVGKMLQGTRCALEVGCGDGFGAPLVAQSVGRLLCTDIHHGTLDDCRQRLSVFKNIEFQYADFRQGPFGEKVDATFSVDVLEHIDPAEEEAFMRNVAASLNEHGICIVGTPNITAEKYASPNSRLGHINLKSHETLRALTARHFHNVFMFSMNDEVLHTGFLPMAHYLWALCAGPRPAPA